MITTRIGWIELLSSLRDSLGWLDGLPSHEWLGYFRAPATQQRLALLERIIQASSHPGDLVLDPFCGCGTTIDAAAKLGRDCIGMDVNQLAISLTKNRLQDTYGRRLKFVIGSRGRESADGPPPSEDRRLTSAATEEKVSLVPPAPRPLKRPSSKRPERKAMSKAR